MTRTATFEITPFDTLMFRDGRPFNQDDPGAAIAVSVFPPLPPTLVGAIRMGLWHLLGGKFPTNQLGNGTNWQDDGVLGPLGFSGIRLRKGTNDYVPAPLHLLGYRASDDMPEQLDVMQIGREIQTDLGKISLPKMPKSGPKNGHPKPLAGHWISLDGLADMQKGKLPSLTAILSPQEIFAVESRVGIGINRKKGVVNDGELYMASHIRLQDDVTLVVDIRGLPEELPKHIHFTVAFGGEGRSARFSETNASQVPEPEHSGHRIAVALLSPADLRGAATGPGDELVPGYTLDTVCAGKAITAGGWDFVEKRPIPLRQLAPAGSVFFLSRKDENAKLPKSIGRASEWGLGQCCVLPWPKGAN